MGEREEQTKIARTYIELMSFEAQVQTHGAIDIDEEGCNEALRQFSELSTEARDKLRFVLKALKLVRADRNRVLPARISRRALLQAAANVKRKAGELREMIANFQNDLIPGLPVENERLNWLTQDRMTSCSDATYEIDDIVDAATDIIKRNVKPRAYAYADSQSRTLIFWLTIFWIAQGEKVKTTNNGKFANYLSAALSCIGDKEVHVNAKQLSLAKRASDEIVGRVPEDVVGQSIVDASIHRINKQGGRNKKNRIIKDISSTSLRDLDRGE